jgi:predicted ArsR family transcriptional regulator
MTKVSVKADHLTSVIERKLTTAGDAGLTAHKLMNELKLSRSCVRHHLATLEGEGRVYSVRRVRPHGGGHYKTFHLGTSLPEISKDASARRDYLVEAFFGPARAGAA